MACNCGKATPKKFKVMLPDGQQFDVNSESQARAEITKAGGGKYKPVK